MIYIFTYQLVFQKYVGIIIIRKRRRKTRVASSRVKRRNLGRGSLKKPF